jgi:protein-tyrosine phosphatase
LDENVYKTHARLKGCPPALLVYIIYRRLKELGPRPTWLWVKDKIKRRTLGFSPPEISRVTPHVYVGGQHKRHGLDAMREQGITAVVNMREETDDAEKGLLLDHYLWLPTTDDAPPSLEDLVRGVDFIESHAEQGEGVYIHCAAGVGRAPTMAAAYLVRQGATPEQAWKRIQQGRPFVRVTPLQLEVIRTFALREQVQEAWMEDTPEPQAEKDAETFTRAGSTTGSRPSDGPPSDGPPSDGPPPDGPPPGGSPPSSEAAPDEELELRVQLACERIAEDPELTGALTDEPASVLLRWAEDRAQSMALKTAGQDEDSAWKTLDAELRPLRRQVRNMAEAAADSPDPVSTLQELIDKQSDQES